MKKSTIIGLAILIIGALSYLILIENLSGMVKALLMGLIFGSGYALSRLSSEKKY